MAHVIDAFPSLSFKSIPMGRLRFKLLALIIHRNTALVRDFDKWDSFLAPSFLPSGDVSEEKKID